MSWARNRLNMRFYDRIGFFRFLGYLALQPVRAQGGVPILELKGLRVLSNRVSTLIERRARPSGGLSYPLHGHGHTLQP